MRKVVPEVRRARRRELIAWAVVAGIAGFLLAPSVYAQNDDLRCPSGEAKQDRFRYLRSLSLDLRGVVPSVEELEVLANEADVPEAMIDAWLQGEQFAGRVVRRHRDLLWSNIQGVRLLNNNSGLGRDRNTGLYWRRNPARMYRGDNVTCLDEPARFAPDGEILTTELPDGTRREGYVMVTPYWNPDTQLKVCAFDAQDRLVAPSGVNCGTNQGFGDPACGCGPQLRWCTTGNEQRRVTAAMARDLELRIEALILEDRPYTELFTGRRAFVNGPLSFYYRHQTSVGRNVAMEPQPVPMEQLPELSYWEEDSWAEVQLDTEHAGVLTSPVFLLRFMTNRARAARFYDAFLCEPFQPPAGGLPLGDATCNAEPDLQKRCGCKYCHALLEPSAAYWGRWAESGAAFLEPRQFPALRDDCETCARTGRNCSQECRRFYVTRAFSDAEEAFLGQLQAYQFRRAEHELNVEMGPRLLAQSAVADNRLPTCTATRTAQWLLGRDPLPDEQEWIAQIAREFAWSNYSYRALVKSIVTSDVYRRVR